MTDKDKRAIENGFPIGLISQLAEHESWRKEVYRPLSYIHKWWAKRLGSVFRAIIIASCADWNQDVTELFWKAVDFPNTVVFDPFMGSGTTIHEAIKLGCRVIGRDINPVAFTMVHASLQHYSREAVRRTFEQISDKVGTQIRSFYTATAPTGEQVDVLYYFWVKVISCPTCSYQIDLFKSRVFAKHAYPKKYPQSKALCPTCYAINTVQYTDLEAQCERCNTSYHPHSGTVSDSKVTCPRCHTISALIDTMRTKSTPPEERMYAKMVLYQDGTKDFLPIDQSELESYHRAEGMLPSLWSSIPQMPIQPGYNTNQILNYNYRYWYQLFNTRQLVSLALLSAEIARIERSDLRELFACLFSGILEFNNMFATFKGIGTGAVRHMFSHHILKPELTPLEANPWGTDKSSGSFSTLFESRILRALDYKSNPFELRTSQKNGEIKAEKLYGINRPINTNIAADYQSFVSGNSVYLSVGDSSHTDIANASIDLVITDPPFFDNVHYSELADFFYVWLRNIIGSQGPITQVTTRSPLEVQSTDVHTFTERLTAVFTECNRVLKDQGLLVFTYHHSRNEGWIALYKALREAGFWITRTHPVKAEMAVAIPIQQSESPVNFDLIIVCRKTPAGIWHPGYETIPLSECLREARETVAALQSASISVSPGDARLILVGCLLSRLAEVGDLSQEVAMLQSLEKSIDTLAQDILHSNDHHSIQQKEEVDGNPQNSFIQMSFPLFT